MIQISFGILEDALKLNLQQAVAQFSLIKKQKKTDLTTQTGGNTPEEWQPHPFSYCFQPVLFIAPHFRHCLSVSPSASAHAFCVLAPVRMRKVCFSQQAVYFWKMQYGHKDLWFRGDIKFIQVEIARLFILSLCSDCRFAAWCRRQLSVARWSFGCDPLGQFGHRRGWGVVGGSWGRL